jgi:hypothetical protein
VDNPLAFLSRGWRVLNALRVAWKYVALQVYPAVLSCDYSFNQIPTYHDWRHTLPAALAAAAVFGAWLWALRIRRKGWVVAGVIYFAGFATTANILIPSGTIMADRLAYLPSAGFCLLLALCWNWVRRKKEYLAWGVLAVIVVAFSVRTIVRNRDWKDAFSLYSAAARDVPNSVKMHVALGEQYEQRNQLGLASIEYRIALAILPDFSEALAADAGLEYRFGHYQAAGELIEKALSRSSRADLDYDYMIVTYASILIKTNRSAEALKYLNRETVESPLYVQGWFTRAALHYQNGEMEAARADAHTGLRLRPDDPRLQEAVRRLDAAAPPPLAAQP